MMPGRFCVCIPARNEVARLPVLLDALAAQDVLGPIAVALCLNNSDDGSAQAIEAARARHRGRLAIALDACRLPAEHAHAGTARRRAMDAGAALAGDDGVLLSTDADCRPPADWVRANLAAFARGGDIVGGQIMLDEAEDLDPAVAAIRARLDRYWVHVRAIEDSIDPQPHDPPPRHGDHTGASLAIRVALYRAAGGVPAIASGEDRALVTAAVAAGGRLVHPIAVWTRTSARSAGRAAGGMADAMREIETLLRDGGEPHVPHLDHWRARAAWRAAQRTDTARARRLTLDEAALPKLPCDLPLSALA